MTDTVLFDIDGTLVDSNYLHVEAWAKAFEKVGHPVDAWRIHRSIGMDSEKLLEELLGDDAERLADSAKEANTAFYAELMPRLRAFDGARELLAELNRRGTTVVLATSAPDNELEALRAVLDVEDSITTVTAADDVETAKPAPDIVEVALERSKSNAATTIMVGDSVWDVKAAASAGVSAVGVLTGGVSAGELLAAGAVAVYNDVRQLLERLDDSPLA